MQLVVGKIYKTRSGREVGIVREIDSTPGKDFVKVSENRSKFIGAISPKNSLEVFNGDGSYIKSIIEHPLDIVSELQ
jgi:hypothetical protein